MIERYPVGLFPLPESVPDEYPDTHINAGQQRRLLSCSVNIKCMLSKEN